MTDWDRDSALLQSNLIRVLSQIRDDARARKPLSAETARLWHAETMHGLTPSEPRYVAAFRGEPGLEGCEVQIGSDYGVRSDQVKDAISSFEVTLQEAVALLDELIPPERDLTADEIGAVIDLCAWAHAEWVRIHPFANGNGRTARFWVNAIAMRYGLPPFVRLRPRPDGGYGAASEAAMRGNRQPMADVFRRMYRDMIRN